MANNMADWQKILKEIENNLIPHYELDVWERGLYYHLLGKTRVSGHESATLPLSELSTSLICSQWQVRKVIRKLAEKGCIELEQTRKGHCVKVLLPGDLNIPCPSNPTNFIDIDKIDFFKNREHIESLLRREENSCFYCLKSISTESCELDHVVPQIAGGNNSYRNIVATCHRRNTRKQGLSAEDYLRAMYRQNFLGESEFNDRLVALEALKNGELCPVVFDR